MKKSFIAIVLGGILALQVNAAPIYNLYNAHRAMRVDDILTVVIIESAKAGSQMCILMARHSLPSQY